MKSSHINFCCRFEVEFFFAPTLDWHYTFLNYLYPPLCFHCPFTVKLVDLFYFFVSVLPVGRIDGNFELKLFFVYLHPNENQLYHLIYLIACVSWTNQNFTLKTYHIWKAPYYKNNNVNMRELYKQITHCKQIA